MTLTNIFKEPRREITESAIGLSLVGGCTYCFSIYFQANSGAPPCPWPIGLVVGIVLAGPLIAVGSGIIYGSHALGEAICNTLERRGVHLRPRQRFN